MFLCCSFCLRSVPQSFGRGDVVEVKGLAVAVPEGVVVELKQPQGGFVFQRHGSRTLLEEVEALKVQSTTVGYKTVVLFCTADAISPDTPRRQFNSIP